MSAFSRGFLLRHQCLTATHLLIPRPASSSQIVPSSSKHLSTSPLFHYAKPRSAARPPKSIQNNKFPNRPSQPPSQSSPQASKPPIYQTYAETLAAKSHPTLLYQSPSHTAYYIASYAGAAFCLSYAGYNFYINTYNPPEHLPSWVPSAFAGVCLCMAAMGGWLLLAPSRIVRSITALPSSTAMKKLVSKPGGATAAPAPTAAGRSTAPLRIQIDVKRLFPLPRRSHKIVTTTPAEMRLNRQIYTPPPHLTLEERVRLQRLQEREKEIERSKILTAPFRHASQAFYKLFRAVSRSFTREGFLQLGANGQTYKLDVTAGWALDEGRALDRLVKLDWKRDSARGLTGQ